MCFVEKEKEMFRKSVVFLVEDGDFMGGWVFQLYLDFFQMFVYIIVFFCYIIGCI